MESPWLSVDCECVQRQNIPCDAAVYEFMLLFIPGMTAMAPTWLPQPGSLQWRANLPTARTNGSDAQRVRPSTSDI